MATKLEGGGGKALVARPLVEELFFCGFPYLTKKSCTDGGNPTIFFLSTSLRTCYTCGYLTARGDSKKLNSLICEDSRAD